MKKFLLSLAAVALCASAGMAQENVSETWTLAKDNVSTTFPCTFSPKDGITWTINKTGSGTLQNLDSTKGQQFGSSKTPIATLTITTDSFSDKDITEIVVNTSCANSGNSSLSVKVGDTVLSNNNTNDYKLTTTATDVVFNASSTCKGNIELKWSVSEKAIYVKSITVKYNDGPEDTRTDAGLSFPRTEYTANLGESFTAPELTKATTADVTYTSSNPEVATVDDATGAVTLVTAGTTTITAICGENDEYKAGTASYTLIVTDPNAPYYTLATSLDQLGKSARILIVNTEGKKALSTNFKENNVAGTDVVISEKGIQPSVDVQVVMLDKDGESYTLRVGEAIYLSNDLTEKANKLVKSDTKQLATISFSNSDAEIKFSGTDTRNILRYNNSNNGLFACYSSGQKPVQIYVDLKSVVPDVVTPEKKDLDRAIVVGDGTNEDIVVETELWPEDNTFKEQHIYLPENNDIVEMKFNIDAALTNEMFDGIALWSMSDDTTNENVSEEIFTTEGTYAILTPSTAGNYRMRFELKENDHYNSFIDNNYYVHVYPHVNDHFNYDDTELNTCLNDGIFTLNKHDQTNDGSYDYFYKATKNGAAARTLEDEGYTKYNHETGIALEDGLYTLEFVAEKNGVRSYQPKTFSISVSTGVEAIGAEAGEAVYFDLQGRRVNGQPEQGLYIVRKGGKTSKVIL